MIDVSVVIVSWNVANLLDACLRSIRAHGGGLALEVIVVDSASEDDTVQRVQADHGWVKLLPQDENVGFTRGNNIGLAAARGRYLMLLNPDTVVHEGMLAGLVRYLENHPGVGIVGPHTLNPDGSTQSSRRRFPTVATGFFESTPLQPYAPRRMLDRYYVAQADDAATVAVDWVQGHALLARRTVYEAIGGLDEGFVMYFEEMDWCKRAKAAGWGVVYVGGVQVTHYGGQSTEQAGAFAILQFNRSKVCYFEKHHGRGVAVMLRGILTAGFVWQAMVEAVKWGLRHKPELRRERLRRYWQILRAGL